MLQSLVKILVFFAITLAVAMGLIWIGDTGDSLTLTFGGRLYVLGPVTVFVALLLLMVLGWAILRLVGFLVASLRFLLGDETAVSRYFERSRSRKGYEALGEGMLAVASGEAKLAQSNAQRAAKYLDAPHLTNLLQAQAAELAGDDRAAEANYRKMLDDPRTRFVAIRGLMQQRMDKGDIDTALQLAKKAYAIKPGHTQLQDTLLGLQARAHDWKGARQVLKDKRKAGQLPADLALRRDAVLALQEAKEVLDHEASISAREAAISANKASPDLIPAAVLAARSYLARGDKRNATRVLNKTWSVRPHPSIAAAYAEIVPDETPAQRLRRFEELIRQKPDDPESHLLQAELLLAAEDFPGARRALGDMAAKDPTVRSLSIMAAVERGEGADEAVVRGWLARALTASRGPQWVCDNCQNIMTEWSPVCDSCGGFDTLTWRVPDAKAERLDDANLAAAAMLPLLAGDAAKKAGDMSVPAVAETASGADLAKDVVVSKAVAEDLPDVAPGMVPREEDYPSERRMTS